MATRAAYTSLDLDQRSEQASKRRADVLELMLKAADAGEILSVPELKARLSWGSEITKHGLLYILNVLQREEYLDRRWGPELGEQGHGKTSFIIPKKRAYEVRAGR